MNPPAEQPAPRYVTCHCRHCDGHIEFDANELAEENSIVPCPHCGRETVLSSPKDDLHRQTTPQPQNTGLNPDLWHDLPGSDDDKFILHNPHGPATPKQVAYLKYMGVSNTDQLSKKEAADLIDANPFLHEVKSMAEFDRLRSHQDNWHEQRLILYPDLYADELKYHLTNHLPDLLHTYVRGQVVGASERLTKSKIRDIVNALTGENARWWHESDYQAVFWERLKQKYPKCCDGHPPTNRT
jgi:hypothetical protein